MKKLVIALTISLLMSPVANANVISSVPGYGNPDWGIFRSYGTSLVNTSSGALLTTTQNAGIWVGNHPYSPALWSFVSPNDGHRLHLNTYISSNSSDWRASLFDGSYVAQIWFNPTFCPNNCYSTTPSIGVAVDFADAGGALQQLFLPVDTSVTHEYSYELLSGQVQYYLDGVSIFSGPALQSSLTAQLFVGDPSVVTLSGLGSMTIQSMEFTIGPFNVPEPSNLALFGTALAGIALIGLRRRSFSHQS